MLISQMLQVNVDARFTAEEVLSHPWVTVRAQVRSNVTMLRTTTFKLVGLTVIVTVFV